MFLVSYQIGGVSGNQTFTTPEQAEQYVSEHRGGWQSASLFSYEPEPGGVSTLAFIRQLVTPPRG